MLEFRVAPLVVSLVLIGCAGNPQSDAAPDFWFNRPAGGSPCRAPAA